MSKILKVLGREILDSRGTPTIEAEIYLKNGVISRAIVPSGASIGSQEALELRDNDMDRYYGKGVMKSVFIINNIISKEIIGLDVTEQTKIDNILINLDNTANKSKLGANSILAVSLAVTKAAAKYLQVPLYVYISQLMGLKQSLFTIPVPMINIINGGCHADNNIDIQEFMIIPVGASTFKNAIRIASEIFVILGQLLKASGKKITIGDEGGYSPDLKNNEEALSLITRSIENAGYKLFDDVCIALDCASTEFYFIQDKYYFLKGENKKYLSYEFVDYLDKLVKTYPIISIEDGLSESDWEGYQYLTEVLGKKIQLVGDDLLVTNSNLLLKAINKHIVNAILIKPNQIGTITETIKTINIAKKHNYNYIISHRSGESEDTFIADLSVGSNSEQIKCGSVSRTERVAKYNRLLRIEEYLGLSSIYKGIKVFKN